MVLVSTVFMFSDPLIINTHIMVSHCKISYEELQAVISNKLKSIVATGYKAIPLPF